MSLSPNCLLFPSPIYLPHVCSAPCVPPGCARIRASLGRNHGQSISHQLRCHGHGRLSVRRDNKPADSSGDRETNDVAFGAPRSCGKQRARDEASHGRAFQRAEEPRGKGCQSGCPQATKSPADCDRDGWAAPRGFPRGGPWRQGHRHCQREQGHRHCQREQGRRHCHEGAAKASAPSDPAQGS